MPKRKPPTHQSFEGKAPHGKFTKLCDDMMESLAWTRLTLRSRGLYLEMKKKYTQKTTNGLLVSSNVDDISFTTGEAMPLYKGNLCGFRNDIDSVATIPKTLGANSTYAIQRNMKRRYFKYLYLFIVCGIFVPFQVRMIPLVQMMSKMHLMNRTGMFLLYLAATAPQAIFLTVGYLKGISPEIEEAAIIDGCGPVRTYFSVVFPLMKPILATVLIKDALFVWNDFQLPLIILNKTKSNWTLQLFQYNFKAQYSFDFNLAFASFLLTMLPLLILYVFMQKYIVSGLTAGAVKG